MIAATVRGVTALTGCALALSLISGCAASGPRSAARGVAVRFVEAVESDDGAGACRLMTPDARTGAVGATDASCQQAVLNVDESGSAVHRVQVWGDAAQVRVGSDTVFLRHLRGGWRIAAAGCKPRGNEQPYDCDVEG